MEVTHLDTANCLKPCFNVTVTAGDVPVYVIRISDVRTKRQPVTYP